MNENTIDKWKTPLGVPALAGARFNIMQAKTNTCAYQYYVGPSGSQPTNPSGAALFSVKCEYDSAFLQPVGREITINASSLTVWQKGE